MDPVNGINKIVENLRREIAKGDRSKKSSSTSGGKKNAAPISTARRKSDVTLKSRITERVALLDKNNQNYYKNASITILESVLAWEFGDQFLNDPNFTDLINDVYKTMHSDSAVNKKFIDLIDNLGEP